MDYLIRSLLRKYQTTRDPSLAIEIAELSLKLIANPTAQTDEFYRAWWWLHEHPAFFYKGRMTKDNEPGFWEALDMSVQKVDPTTRRIEDDKTRNTHVEIWLEVGPWHQPEEMHPDFFPEGYLDRGVPGHDYELDCGGDTYEAAIIKMAELVKANYGDYQK